MHRFDWPARALLASVACVAIACVTAASAAPIAIAQVQHAGPVSFSKEVLPIFTQNCLACHNAKKAESGLVLETAQSIVKGGESGPAVVAGKSGESLLLKAASHADEPNMPPANNKVGAVPLKPEQLGLIKLWIDEGAKGDAGVAAGPIAWQPLPPGVNPIYSVSISPDGQLAACGRANQVFIYHVPSGRLVTRLTDSELLKSGLYKQHGVAHLDLMQSLAFSPAGDLLATGAYREVKLWQRPRDRRRFDIAGLASPGQCVAVNPAGSLVAVGTADGTIGTFDLTGGKPIAKFTGHTAGVTSLRFLAAGDKLVSVSADKSIRVWTVADGALVSRIDTPTPIAALALLDAGRAATGGGDNLIRTWTLPTGPATRPELPPAVTNLVASADGKLLAAAGAEGNIAIIEVASLKAVKTLPGRKVAVVSLSITPNGSRLAAAEADGTIRVWEVAAGTLLASLRSGEPAISSLAIHPSGNQLASAAGEGKLSTWKLDLPTPATLAAQTKSAPTATATSPDGKLLAIGATVDDKPAVLVVETASGNVVKTLSGHAGAVISLAFNADGSKLVSGSADNTARVWNLADGKELAKFAGHAQAVTGVALDAQAATAYSGSADGALKSWTVADAKEAKNFAGHTAAISSLALSSNGQQIVSASADKTVRVWNAGDPSQVRVLQQAAAVARIALARDDIRLAIASDDGAVKLLQLADGKDLFTFAAGKEPLRSLALSGDGQRLVVADAKQATVWDLATGAAAETFSAEGGVGFAAFTANAGELLLGAQAGSIVRHALHFERALPGPTKRVVRIAYRPDGGAIYAASEDGTLRGFQPSGQPTFTANHSSAVRDLAVSPDGKWLATAGDDKLARVWSADNGSPGAKAQLAGLSSAATRLAFSADSTKLVVAGATPQDVLVFNLATGTAEQSFAEHAAPVVALAAIGQESRLAVSVGSDQTVHVWPLAAGVQLAGHSQPVAALEASPIDKTLLVSGSADGSIRKWNVPGGQQAQQIDHGSPLTALAMRGDGQQLASAGANGLIRLWNAANGQSWSPPGGQPLAEMKGELRAQLEAAQLERAVARGNSRLGELKRLQGEAEARVKSVAEEVTKANTAKDAAAKTLADKTEAAKKPIEAKAMADKEAETTAAALKAATEQLTQAKAAAEKDKNNADLAKASQAAQKALEEAERNAKQAERKAKDLAGPANKATLEMNTAEAAKQAAEQAVASAMAAQQKATETLPIAQNVVKAGEANVAQAQSDLDNAKKAVTAAEKPVRSLAYSPDGSQFASGGDNQVVRTWSSESGTPLDALAGHAAPVAAVAFAGESGVVSLSADKGAIVWETNPAWQLVRTIGNTEKPEVLVDRVTALTFSPDDKLLATGGGEPSRSGELKIFNVADGALARAIPDAHSDTILGLDFSPDGSLLASCGADRFVKIFTLADGKLARAFEGHTHHVLDVAWRSDGRMLASAGADNVVKVWDYAVGEQKLTTQPLGKEVTSLSFVSEGPRVLVSSGDRSVRLMNTDNGGNERNYGGANDFLYCAAVTPDGRLAVAGGQESILFVWNVESAQLLRSFAPPKPPTETAGK